MPDRSYYPDSDSDPSSVFIETTSDPAQFMKDTLLVASYRQAARNADIPVQHTYGNEGQTLQFRNAAERQLVEDKVRESERSLIHTETFTRDHQHPYYMRAWTEVVEEAMQGREHPVTGINICEELEPNPQAFVTFPDMETKRLFMNLDRDGAFTEYAVARCNHLMREAELDPRDPMSLLHKGQSVSA